MPKTIGRFKIIRLLGRGGMAEVYLAQDPSFDRQVAVKLLPQALLHDPQFRTRFGREARVIAALEHEAIVPVFDYGEENGQPFLVMRYIPGGSLREKMIDGPLALHQVNEIISRIAPALDKAHRNGVIHRDVKPENILLGEEGEAYISDFGVAKISQGGSALTGSGVVGTPNYMSPEQVLAKSKLDGRSDQYALAIVVYEMLAGKPLFKSSTPMGLAMAHISEKPPSVVKIRPDIPHGVASAIEKGLSKTPSDRFATVREFADGLKSFSGASVGVNNKKSDKKPRPAQASRLAGSKSAPRGRVKPVPSTRLIHRERKPGLSTARAKAIRSKNGLAIAIGSLVVIGILLTVVSNNAPPSALPQVPITTETVQSTSSTQAITTPTSASTATNAIQQNLLPVISQALSVGKQLENLIAIGDAPPYAVNANGQLLATLDGGSVVLWNILEGEVTGILESTKPAKLLTFSPDGEFAAIGWQDGTVSLWQMSTGVVRTMAGHDEFQFPGNLLADIAFSPDGKLLASGSVGGVRVSRVSDGTLLHTFFEGGMELVFSLDGQILAGDSGSGSRVHLWSVEEGSLLQTLTHSWFPDSFAFSPDGQILASTNNKVLLLWSVSSGAVTQTLEGHEGQINRVSFSPTGDFLASSSIDLSTRLWSVTSGAARIFQTSYDASFAFSPDGELFAAETPDGVGLWRISDGILLQELDEGTTSIDIDDLAFSPDGRFLYVTHPDHVSVWAAPLQ